MSTETPIAALVGLNVARLRRQRGWSQETLSVHLRGRGLPWSREIIAKVEAGKRSIALAELFVVAYLFDATPRDLLAFGEPDGENHWPSRSERAEALTESRWVELTPAFAMAADHVAAFLAGDAGVTIRTDFDALGWSGSEVVFADGRAVIHVSEDVSGSWGFVVDISRADPGTGKTKLNRRTRRGFATEEDAEQAVSEALVSLIDKLGLQPSDKEE